MLTDWIPRLHGTQYHNGSWLREHVDTGDTHIISAIMNIDQDVEEDWHLTFIDHNGDRHYITLEVRLWLVASGCACRACMGGRRGGDRASALFSHTHLCDATTTTK